MTTQPLGERIKRNEDPRLLTGRALFIDDLDLPGIAHVAFLRSPYAHARILSIDTSRARQREGVIAVFTAEDLGSYWQPGPLLVPPPPVEGMVFHQRTQAPLAKDKVRHRGEPVALVVATSRYVAEDAVEDIEVDYDPLPAVVDLESALEHGAPLIHEDVGSNMAAYVPQKQGDYAAARAQADVVIR
ncbi:MAG: xanthine dehydrogenase family protein molybdopterin-binding subunit, partial [Thermoanaerobaculia bacterium]